MLCWESFEIKDQLVLETQWGGVSKLDGHAIVQVGKFAAGLFGALFCFQQATFYLSLSFKERNCGF